MPLKLFVLFAGALQASLVECWWFSDSTTCADADESSKWVPGDEAVPLVLSENAFQEEGTGCWRIPAGDRGELYLHQAGVTALQSANCPAGISLVSWNGHARGGKSFMASEFTTLDNRLERNFSSHFALGHQMDSCSKGIFVSATPLPHPHHPEVCVFQVDVEGLNAFGVESNMQSDAELAIFTYLTSSIWVFNSRSTFDAHSIDLLRIVTNLAENMEIGDRNLLRLPVLHWVLQSVHLMPTIEGKEVSAEEYLKFMLDTYDDPVRKRGSEKEAAKQRNEIREAITRSFQVPLRVTALSPATSEPEILRQLPHVPRNHPAISDQFVRQLDLLKEDILGSSAPVQLQRAHKLITATSETLLHFMNSTLGYLNKQQPIPVFNAVDAVIQMQIDKAKSKLILSWRECLQVNLTRAAAHRQNMLLSRIQNLSNVKQVSLPYWSDFLLKNVSHQLGNTRIPLEQSELLAIHQGCYRVSLASELQPLNEESHDVQVRLVSRVEEQLGIGKHENDTNAEISGFVHENFALAQTYNRDLVEFLWDAHLSHLRLRFQAVLEEDFVDMLRVLDGAYAKLSVGPNAHKIYLDSKQKFIVQAESYVAFGKTFRKMEQRHDEEIAIVRRQIEAYQSELTRLQNEYDTLNAERGRMQREMDLQQEQHRETIKQMRDSLANMNQTNSKLQSSQWQLKQQLASQMKEREEAITKLQQDFEARRQEQTQQHQSVNDQLLQKQGELDSLAGRMDEQARENQNLREELRRMNEQECGTRTVRACTGSGYSGTCKELSVSWWSHCSLINAGLPDNSIRSARVPPGCRFTVFSNEGYNGQQATFNKDTPDISSYVSGVSSARVF